MENQIELKEDGKTILIENLQLQNEDLHQILNKLDKNEQVDYLLRAISIGAIGLKRMGTGEELDFVEKGFNSMITKFDQSFDPNSNKSHIGKLSGLIDAYFKEGGTVENLFNIDDENTHLGKFRKEFQNEFKEIKGILNQKKGEEKITDITPLKGFEFEDECDKILCGFVNNNFGDSIERTSKNQGTLTGRIVGDFVITLGDAPDKKIVLEIKDKGKISQNEIINNLEEAMKNRNAKYGIFVTRYKESLPKHIGWFNEFKGNILICAMGSKEADTFLPEVLLIAYQWARLKMKKDTKIGKETNEILINGIKEIETKLSDFSLIKGQCTNIENSSGKIRNLLTSLENDLKDKVNKMQNAISIIEKAN